MVLGLSTLVLAVARVLWRRAGLPPWTSTLSSGERTLATWSERTLLATLFAIPLTGLAVLLGEDDLLPLHVATHVVFFVAIAVHVGLVLKHTLVDRDRLLSRDFRSYFVVQSSEVLDGTNAMSLPPPLTSSTTTRTPRSPWSTTRAKRCPTSSRTSCARSSPSGSRVSIGRPEGPRLGPMCAHVAVQTRREVQALGAHLVGGRGTQAYRAPPLGYLGMV